MMEKLQAQLIYMDLAASITVVASSSYIGLGDKKLDSIANNSHLGHG